jgi:hypothetical protein
VLPGGRLVLFLVFHISLELRNKDGLSAERGPLVAFTSVRSGG